MNQGKLEVVKQEMARVIVNILGISKLKWTEMCEFTQMAIISTIAGKNPLEEMKQLGQSANDAQLWICLVVKVKFNAIKNNIAQEPGMLSPQIKVN